MHLLASVLTEKPTFLGGEVYDLTEFRRHAHALQCVRIDNVVRYWAEHSNDMVVESAPSLRPPFPVMWMEGVRGPEIVGGGVRQDASGLPVRWGCYIKNEGPSPRGGTMIAFQFFGNIASWHRPFSFGSVAFRIDEGGAVIEDSDKPYLWGIPKQYRGDAEAIDRYTDFLGYLLDPVKLAIGFMHCKNVKRREAAIPRAERRRAERAGAPTVKFYELAITPMSESSGGDGTGDGAGVSLHICRGHFATYDEKPLFGKYRGTFWVPAHVRGRADVGIVHKTYAVEVPA